MYCDRLRNLRLENNLIHRDVANILNIDRSQYGHYESEYDIIPLKYLNVLCNYYKVSVDYIFGLSDELCYDNIIHENINRYVAGERLKKVRKDNKLTQVKLAQMIGTVHPTIVNYENGKNLINTSFLFAICNTCHVSADYLLGKIDYNPLEVNNE